MQLGYRHIDTAHAYENHQDIKKGIEHVDRACIYLTSKLAVDEQVQLNNIEASVQKSCEKALHELGTDYLDLYLIHWPVEGFPLPEIFKAMEKLITQGKIITVGVSNYNIAHLEALKKQGFIPFANQVEFHPYLNQKELLNYCNLNQIKLIAFRPFGKGKLLTEEPLFDQIGAKYGKNSAQVILRWLAQKKIPVIPKASSEKHLLENLKIFDFSLNEEEINQLDNLGKNHRYCKPDHPAYDPNSGT